jgi:hypothetical protein
MGINKRKFIYINNKEVDGTVFQTQILDWLNLFHSNGISFDLIQAYHIKEIRHPVDLRQKTAFIRKGTKLFKGRVFLFPSKSVFAYVNALILYLKIFRSLVNYSEVVIFSRALIGREIRMLQKMSGKRIIFFFDARAASAEEHRYNAIKHGDFSRRVFNTISDVYYLECETVKAADRIFSVSEVLMHYFNSTYGAYLSRYVRYPCLSDSSKFYFNTDIRRKTRDELGIKENTRLFIYAGGIEMEWHMTESMFAFYHNLSEHEDDLTFLFLTKDIKKIEAMLERYPSLKSRLLYFSVPNSEVYKYLNAADYGLLFRENHIMNNVASPTKFAEYMLCGLPVIISEGVGDYADFAVREKVGYLLKESELRDLRNFDYENFLKEKFNRDYISTIGIREFSKQSVVKTINGQFTAEFKK